MGAQRAPASRSITSSLPLRARACRGGGGNAGGREGLVELGLRGLRASRQALGLCRWAGGQVIERACTASVPSLRPGCLSAVTASRLCRRRRR